MESNASIEIAIESTAVMGDRSSLPSLWSRIKDIWNDHDLGLQTHS